jgi:CubicO group peptidase (beta-lactamase class C family)
VNALILCILLSQSSTDIDAIAAKEIDPAGPGVAILAIRGGKVVHRKGYGFADLEAKAGVTTETLFDLASCSKQFTALGILILMEGKKLKLEDDVRKWLKELKVHDARRPIRVQDLVYHTSGLGDYLPLAAKAADPTGLKNEDALRLIAEESLDFKTGTRWAYSNTNYCLLALIIERITKKSFGAFMKSEIFRPMGMKTGDVLEPGAKIKNPAVGYQRDGGSWLKAPQGPLTTGDGGIWLSLDDWAAFEAGLARLLKKPSLELAWTNGKLDNGDPHQYGFGLLVGKAGGGIRLGHEGQWLGFRSFLERRVDQKITLVIMSNREDINFMVLSSQIMAKLLE